MIDVTKAAGELTKETKYAVAWLEANGFTGKLMHEYPSKVVFLIQKDGDSVIFELPQGFAVKNMEEYMAIYGRNFAEKKFLRK
ncbi:hypothetical protein TAMA11512_04020 [Selenomonas sp. TAMA-11512]|uniref:hypothetical protein n=1 Tax=Selenomonas sp. TAMA-11512 TaxID=3095337 RepID=UPI003089C84F|nr:hypothetical protein TAMA11512_04020 [Selenomonas sp. TAMA-11512]